MENKREDLIRQIGLKAWQFQQEHEVTEFVIIAAYVTGAYSDEARAYWLNEFTQQKTK